MKFLTLLTLFLCGSFANAQDKCEVRADMPQFTYCRTTGEIESGPGKEFGRWYSVTNASHPGWQLVTAAFWLNGGHPCFGTESSPRVEKNGVRGNKPWGAGSWSECYEDTRDANSVVWKVRLQGVEKTDFMVGNGSLFGWHVYGERVKAPFELVTYWKTK